MAKTKTLYGSLAISVDNKDVHRISFRVHDAANVIDLSKQGNFFSGYTTWADRGAAFYMGISDQLKIGDIYEREIHVSRIQLDGEDHMVLKEGPRFLAEAISSGTELNVLLKFLGLQVKI